MGFYIITALFAIGGYLPFFRVEHWSFRMWDFVRIQTTVILIVLSILTTIFYFPESLWEWVILALALCTIVMQASLIIRFTKLYPVKNKTPKNHSTLQKISLITANVLQTNTHYDAFKAIIDNKDPDILLTMESNSDWEKALRTATHRYPYKIAIPLENLYGMHLYSKLPLTKSETHYLIEKNVPSIFTKVQLADKKSFNLICVHPAPPSPTENETSKERDAELLVVGEKVRNLKNPIVVCGDLNDVVWSRISKLFQKMTGLLDPRVGRGLYSSFHAGHWYLRFPIDQLFYSDDMHVVQMERSPYFGSDHFAMYYEILIEKNAPDHTEPELDCETEEEINDRIQEGIQEGKQN